MKDEVGAMEGPKGPGPGQPFSGFTLLPAAPLPLLCLLSVPPSLSFWSTCMVLKSENISHPVLSDSL